MEKYVIALSLFMFTFLQSNAQILPKEQSKDLVDNCAKAYIESLGEQSILFYGKEQLHLPYNLKNPYLKAKEIQMRVVDGEVLEVTNSSGYHQGRLVYDGVVYPQVTMRLDLYKNELIAMSPVLNNNIVLDPLKVGYASLYDYHIVHLQYNSLKKSLPEGYYLQLYFGKYPVYKKYFYTLDKTPVSASLKESLKYFVYKDGVYHTIKNKGSLLKVLKSNKKELEQYMRDNKLSFGQNSIENTFVLVVKQYEKLNK